MKKGPFKMKGYSYPGASPVKGRRRREQLAKNRARTEEMMDETFDSEIERSTDLMKSEGFIINTEVILFPLLKKEVPFCDGLVDV